MSTGLHGFIMLNRSILDWEWYDDVNTKSVFIHLLLTAAFKDGSWHGIDIRRGQVITSVLSLAKTLNLSESKVRTALKHLKMTDEITDEPYQNFRIITLKNYDRFQSGHEPINEPITNQSRTNDEPITNRSRHRNNVNNDNNVNNVNNSAASPQTQHRTYQNSIHSKYDNSSFDVSAIENWGLF